MAQPEPAPPQSAQPQPAPSKPSHGTGNIVLVVVVVIAAIVAGSVAWYEYQPGGPQNPYKVKISEVIWQQDGAALETQAGFSSHAGKTAYLQVGLYCSASTGFFGEPEPQTCNSGSVYIETPGFSLVWTNAPFGWSSGDSGADATVLVSVGLPTNSYSGNLTINLQ